MKGANNFEPSLSVYVVSINAVLSPPHQYHTLFRYLLSTE